MDISFLCLPQASLPKAGVASRGEAADGSNSPKGTGTGEDSDSTSAVLSWGSSSGTRKGNK